MNVIWSEFLSRLGAQALNLPETGFTPVFNPVKVHLFDLSYRTIIKISGPDAEEFLHGQFSNDLKGLATIGSQINSYSNPKGRLLTIFRITRVNDFYLMSFPADISESVTKRLQMFVMRSNVQIENIARDWVSIGLSGDESASLLSEAGYHVPNEIDAATWDEASSTLIVHCADHPSRYEIYAPNESVQILWTTLSEAATQVSTNFWKLQQIEAGQPEIYASTQESFVAQMVNLQLTGAVNFKKGCYPGQEIIARLQYLGKLKRMMYRYELHDDELPAPGTSVVIKDSGELSGTVVESAYVSDGSVQVLLVLKVADVEAGKSLQLDGRECTDLQPLSLPYSLVEES